MLAIKEDELEEAALDWLENLGYTKIYGSEIEPEGPYPERESFEETILKNRLEDSLRKINPNIPLENIKDVIKQITRISSPNLLIDNQSFHKMVTEGVTTEFSQDNRVKTAIVKIIDFDDPDNNDFLAVNQFTVIDKVDGIRYNRRPDVVLFINGIPVVVIELKNPTDKKADVKLAFQQMESYKNQIPALFRTNELLVISDGLEAKAGSLSANWERYTPWRTIGGEVEEDKGRLQLEVLIRGVLEPEKLLDYIRFFITFEDDGYGNIIKKSAAYHQYHAVNTAITETLRATQKDSDQKIGVVWHTQGSGKSITMMFYTAKLIQVLNNPTIVVITDRNDLDDQLFNTFTASRDLLRQTPIQATARRLNPDKPKETAENIQDLLKTSGGGIVFTTIQKFLPEDDEEEYPLLSERRNIVVIADEAHRSQYSFEKKLSEKGELKEGFAAHIRKALPNASFIGFTATPVDLVDRNTINVFGDYISIYDISQSIQDKTTVPIYYEARLAKIKLDEGLEGVIDDEFDLITEDEEDYAREKLKSSWSRIEKLICDEDRMDKIAEDIITHFDQRLSVIDGKGMIVCMTRNIAVTLYNHIIKFKPEWHSKSDQEGYLKVVMSGSSSDTEFLRPHIRSKGRRKIIERRFKDQENPLKLVIVCDMWLTGFDVPCLHTMYLDKPLKGHNLMQAIARVNRVFKDKPGGLIVDYLGVGYYLKQALSKYSDTSRKNVGVDQEEAVILMKTYHEILKDMFHGFDYSPFIDGTSMQRLHILPKAMDFILDKPDVTRDEAKKEFLKNLSSFNKAYSLAVPHEEALAIRDELAFFQAVRAGIIKYSTPEKERKETIDYAIKQLVEKAVISEDVIDILDIIGIKKPEISVLSKEFLEEIRGIEYKNVAVEVLNKLLQDQIRIRMKKNIIQSRSFEDLLKKSINKYINRTLESAVILEELIELAKKMQEAYSKGEELGLTDDEVAFYDALSTNESAVEIMGDETLKQIAKELVDSVRKSATIDFTVKKSVQAKMRLTVKRLLKKYNYPPDQTPQAVKLIMEQAQMFGEEWATN
ncbi:MAG: type I restriction endonuclease subunit R [Candidatus Heimdallarchaeaceae archaeon]